MTTGPTEPHARSGAVSALAPYLHVADVERSLAFYALLGFARGSAHRSPAGRTVWADARSGEARIMFAQASGPVDAAQQAVLFYMNTDGVAALRSRLLAGGVADGGPFLGRPGPDGGRGVVFEVAFPFYMPSGELRLHDPDGYVVLVGQPS